MSVSKVFRRVALQPHSLLNVVSWNAQIRYKHNIHALSHKHHKFSTGNLCLRRMTDARGGKSTSHSQDSFKDYKKHEGSAVNDTDVKTVILDHALDFVVDYGWSRDALAYGAEAAGYAGVAEGMFVKGGHELALHFLNVCNARFRSFLLQESEEYKRSAEKLKLAEFIRKAIEFRLRMIIPYISVWPEAMSMFLHPTIIASSFEEFARMVDDIWYYAGDKSTDFSWYSKRGILAKTYASTQMVMLQDQSPDFQDTWEFLDRRYFCFHGYYFQCYESNCNLYACNNNSVEKLILS